MHDAVREAASLLEQVKRINATHGDDYVKAAGNFNHHKAEKVLEGVLALVARIDPPAQPKTWSRSVHFPLAPPPAPPDPHHVETLIDAVVNYRAPDWVVRMTDMDDQSTAQSRRNEWFNSFAEIEAALANLPPGRFEVPF